METEVLDAIIAPPTRALPVAGRPASHAVLQAPDYRGLRSSFFAGAGLVLLLSFWLNTNTATLKAEQARINPGVYINAGSLP